jgi:TolB-like protein/Tfp pilus assembly protein PilF
MQSSLWQNLKERKIVQWAIGYLAGAYALLEVTDILGDDFGWPAYVPRVMAVMLGFGFLATLVLAWFHGEQGHQKVPRSELAVLLLIAAIGIPVSWWVGKTTPTRGDASRGDGPTIGRLVDFDAESRARSVAVLPFDNLTGDPQNDHLADGITEDVIAALGNNSDLRVISRTSVMRYKGSQKTVPQIGLELGVGKVLEGSVRVQGGQVRIVVQLIDVSTDAHIWTDTYDGQIENIFALQSRVAQDVAARLNAETSTLLASATVDSTAYRMFSMGRRLASSGNEADRQQARVYFDSAVALDPEFARAYEAIAELDVPDVIDLLGAEPADERTSTAETRISVSSSTASSRAEAAAEKALSINPQLSGAQSSLALQQAIRDGDVVRATENAMKAVAANPNDVRARSRYAQILAGSGQLDRALIELDTAMARDPFSARLATQMGELHFAMGHPDEAMYALHRALDLDSTNVGARITLALVLNQRGETEEALEEIERAAAITPDHAAVQSTHGYLLGQAGRTDEARAVARQLEERARSGRIPGNLVAQVWSAVGDATRAAQWLDRVESSGRRGGEGRGEGHSTRIFVSPTVRYMFSEMRDLPELRSKLDSMGFPVMVVTTDSLRIIPRPPPPTDSLRRRR